MYFLLKKTTHGMIRVSCEGLYDFADEILRSKLKLCSVTLAPSGKLIVVLSEDDLMPETRKKIEKHFDSVMKPMGIKASIVWSIPERGVLHVIASPYVWAGLASSIAVIMMAGFASLFWSLFWGAAAWFAVRGLSLLAKHFRSA